MHDVGSHDVHGIARKFLADLGHVAKAGSTDSFGLPPLMVGGRSEDGVAAVQLYFENFKCVEVGDRLETTSGFPAKWLETPGTRSRILELEPF